MKQQLNRNFEEMPRLKILEFIYGFFKDAPGNAE